MLELAAESGNASGSGAPNAMPLSPGASNLEDQELVIMF